MTKHGRYILPYSVISTHTPAWGVTIMYLVVAPVMYISTHTPAWGVTRSKL